VLGLGVRLTAEMKRCVPGIEQGAGLWRAVGLDDPLFFWAEAL
jgi:hypothetical protein